MVMKKRGVSDVVSTVLIVLLAVAAIAIIGAIVLRNVGETGSKIEGQQACLDIQIKPVSCVDDVVVYEKRAGDGKLVYFSVTSQNNYFKLLRREE